MVRGISDYADESKSAADDAGWQPRAATNAAAYAIDLAAVLAAELDEGRRPSSRARADGTGHGGPTNIAIGNARVGAQGKNVTIHGGIQLGGPPTGSGTAALAARTDEPAGPPGQAQAGTQLGPRRLPRTYRPGCGGNGDHNGCPERDMTTPNEQPVNVAGEGAQVGVQAQTAYIDTVTLPLGPSS